MIQNQILIQSLAIFALLFWGASYQFKERKGILLAQLIGALFYVTHFALLGATTGAVLLVVNILRLATFYYKKPGNWAARPITFWIFIVLAAAGTFYTFTSGWSIFAFIGTVLAITATWQEKPNLIRKIFIPSHISWIIYNISVGSYGEVVAETVFLISTVSALYREKRK